MSWNVNGLSAGRLFLHDTAVYLDRFDIVLLTEARCCTWDPRLLPNHSVTFTAASRDGRAGEGVAVAVRKNAAYHVQDWGSDTDTGL